MNDVTAPDANAALIRRFYDEVFNRGNVAFAECVHGPGYRYHDITMPAAAAIDHATYMARNAGFADAFPDRRVAIEDLIAAGDRVVARAVMRAIHTGPLGGIVPTGRTVRPHVALVTTAPAAYQATSAVRMPV